MKDSADAIGVGDFLSAMFGQSVGEVFFSTLCEPGVQGEPTERHTLTRDSAKVQSFITKWDRKPRGMFFCVGTIKDAKPKDRASPRYKDNIRELVCLWADIDRKGLAEYTAEEIYAAIARLRLQPTIIVESGHGLHLYWIFPAAIPAQENRDRVEQLLKLLCEHVAGDLNVCEISRLMRLPGSHNTKFDSYVPVIVRSINGPRHELSALEGWLGSAVPLTPILRRRDGSGGAAAVAPQPFVAGSSDANNFTRHSDEQGYKQPIDVDARLAAMRYKAPYPNGVNATELEATASLLGRGWKVDDVVNKVFDAVMALPEAAGWDQRFERRKIHNLCLSLIKKNPDIAEKQAATVAAEAADASAAPGAPELPMGLPKAPQSRPKNKEAHAILAKRVLATLEARGEHLLVTPEGTYWYTDGFWRLLDDKELRLRLNREITLEARSLGSLTTSHLVNEAREWMLREPELFRPEIVFNAHTKVPALNGLIDPRTGALTPPALQHYATWRIEHAYDHNAECPIFRDMIAHVFGDREPAALAQIEQLLFEAIGVGLVDKKSKALSRALIFIGDTDTGKSQLLRVIGGFFGKTNATSIKSIESTHGLMPFLYRYPWILDEAGDEGKWHTSSLVKSLISCDPVAINIKNGQIVTRTFTAPIFWGTNHMPQFKEITRAIAERMIPLECRQTFDKLNPVGPAKLARERGYNEPADLVIDTELPGVLAAAIAGLQRALARGYLEVPEESAQLMTYMRNVSNPGVPFRDDCLYYHPGKMLSKADMYAMFSGHYAREYDIDQIPSQTRFGTAMRGLSDPRMVIDDKLRAPGSGKRYYGCVGATPYGIECLRMALESDHFNLGKKKFPGASEIEKGDPTVPLFSGWADNPAVKRAQKLWDLEQEKNASQAKSERVTRVTKTSTEQEQGDTCDTSPTRSPLSRHAKKPLGRNDPRF